MVTLKMVQEAQEALKGIARPFVTMVYGGAEEGVAAYVDKLKAELADTMAMCGARSLADIKRSMLFGF